MNMFDGLICGRIAVAIADNVSENTLAELRLRIGKPPLAIDIFGERKRIDEAGDMTAKILDGILTRATNMSVYSVSDELVRGYIPSKNVRIGVGGEGVLDEGKLIGIKNISYLVLRVPRQIKSAADALIDGIMGKGQRPRVKSTLIISPPGGGKTTVLRELARRISYKLNVVVIDERYELAAISDGAPSLDIGECEVVSGVPKQLAYESCVRAMSPDVIITDELFKASEAEAIEDVMRCGVKVIASVHGDGVRSLEASKVYAPLLQRFERAIVLGRYPAGRVVEEVEL